MDTSVFKKVWDNMLFAMDLNDEIPEHIRQEIVREEAKGNVRHETVEEFNAVVSQKLQPQTEEAFFSEIIVYSAIKKIFLKCIQSNDREPVHVILDGPPASAKSMFLEAMRQKLEGVHYVDCTNATGPGLVEYLLDEVEKMSKENQNVLLNVMETGRLTSTKVRKTASKETNLSIYATTNDIDAISKPFRSRFLEFSLPSYSYDEFCNIAAKLLATRYGHPEELSLKVADIVWNKLKSKDVRDLLSIARLSETIDDVDFVAMTVQKYKRRSDEE